MIDAIYRIVRFPANSNHGELFVGMAYAYEHAIIITVGPWNSYFAARVSLEEAALKHDARCRYFEGCFRFDRASGQLFEEATAETAALNKKGLG